MDHGKRMVLHKNNNNKNLISLCDFRGKVDSLDHLEGSNPLDQMMESGAINQPEPQKQIWCEKKQAAVHEEIGRINQLPANSTYVTHRRKRNVSQEQELELLFAGLSFNASPFIIWSWIIYVVIDKLCNGSGKCLDKISNHNAQYIVSLWNKIMG
ncbi:hypothetical protein CR513_04757, partial [Mucuna pruriens]